TYFDDIHRIFGPDWGPDREATDSPGSLLKPKDLETCLKTVIAPQQGSCAGEAAEVTVPSRSLGDASAYAFVGGSPSSNYFFRWEGPLGEHGSVKFSTGGFTCKGWPACTVPYAFPAFPVVSATTRLYVGNRLGNIVEAYTLRGDADASFSASLLWEKNRVVTSVDGSGKTHYLAKGTNEWVREPLATSLFELTPAS